MVEGKCASSYNIVTVTNATPKKNSGWAERLVFHSQLGPLLWTTGDAKQHGRRAKKNRNVHLIVTEGKTDGGTKRKEGRARGRSKAEIEERKTEIKRERERDGGRESIGQVPFSSMSTFFSSAQLLKLSAFVYNSAPRWNQAINILAREEHLRSRCQVPQFTAEY